MVLVPAHVVEFRPVALVLGPGSRTRRPAPPEFLPASAPSPARPIPALLPLPRGCLTRASASTAPSGPATSFRRTKTSPLLLAPVLQRRGLASPCCPCTAAPKDELADKQAGMHRLLPSTDSPRPCVPWLVSPSSGRRARGRVRRHSCPASEGQRALATAALSTSSFSLRQVGGQGPGWELSTCPAAENGAPRPHFGPFGCAQEAHAGPRGKTGPRPGPGSYQGWMVQTFQTFGPSWTTTSARCDLHDQQATTKQ